MVVNKFNIHWQIVRAKAKLTKDVDEKLDLALTFMNDNPSKENYARLKNWLVMSAMGYKCPEKKESFRIGLDWLNKLELTDPDMDNDLTKISNEDLLLVQKDLLKRKYGFKYEKVPKSHTEFMIMLEEELSKRIIN